MRSLFVLCVVPMTVRVASFVVVPPVRTVQCRGDAFVDAAAPATLSGRSSVTRVRSQKEDRPTATDGSKDDDGDEDLSPEDLSKLASGLLGGAGAGAGGIVADLEDPGKLVREAVKPFQDEMDRIEAEFAKRVEESTGDMQRKLDDMLGDLDGGRK